MKPTISYGCIQREATAFFNKLQRYYATQANFELKPYKLHRLDSGPSTETVLKADEGKIIYTQMKTIRDMETECAKLYREKRVFGFCHLSSGQEAVQVGIRNAMRDKDMIITSYRCHGYAYLMGAKMKEILSELTGRASGISKGRGGSMHMYGSDFYGGNGIVGAQVPLGTGLAFASKYRGSGEVCFALYGDGAANNGQLFEAYNLAKLWSLPVIYVCENNRYAMGTSTKRGSASDLYYTRGDYVPGLWVDGMRLLEVREAMRFAIQYVLANGPLIVETETYRFHGHSMSDPGTSYRTREEVTEVRNTQDPIPQFKSLLLESKLITDEEIKAIDASIKKETAAATQVAKSDPDPASEDVAGDIYSMPLEDVIGSNSWKFHKHKRVGKTENLK